MIHKPEYVKELMRKQLEGSLTPIEAAQLEAARKIYDDGEFIRMASEVLQATEGERSDDPLKYWKPDFARIKEIAERGRRNRNGQLLMFLKVGGAAAAVVLLVLLIGHMTGGRQPSFDLPEGECAGLPRDMDIPASEFACTVRWGDSSEVRIGSGDSGGITQIGTIAVSKNRKGILKLTRLAQAWDTDTGMHDISVATSARQQCIVELPDGVRVRLNAGSELRFPLTRSGGGRMRLLGQAHVRMPGRNSTIRYVIETSNTLLESYGGDFTVLALEGYTRTMLMGGRLVVRTGKEKRQLELDCYGALGVAVRYPRQKKDVSADSLFYSPDGNPGEELAWTKALRTYKDVPLRQFVAETSRWQGFRVKNFNCIPANARISTSVCYKAPMNEIFAAIRDAGVSLYESKGMVSFCDPDKSTIIQWLRRTIPKSVTSTLYTRT
ncbi:FecR domain-containing protein [Olivibacter sp. XZL3]|uniref:FecR domain-containing protein n=1 Tax=Olivibacter sp. XZL3 TaxID=1735116 RepID=UPI001F10CC2E|nr:FecR domain-containing protein [Olivibacter sp. XZL3]